MAEDVGMYDDSEPLAATWGQWKDLADRVKSAGKTDITVTSVDPGEGSTLAEGEFIGVYGDAELVQTADIANTAITTAKIANKAVTSDKIDFSTLVSSMKVVNWAPPYSGEEKEVYLYRIGCLVIICGTWTSESNTAYDNKAVAETLPSGYRPTQNVWIPWTTTQDSQTPFNGAWQFKPNGTVTYSCTATVNSRNTRMAVSGCWITSDDFPS